MASEIAAILAQTCAYHYAASWAAASGMLFGGDVSDVAVDGLDNVYVLNRTPDMPIRVFTRDGRFLRGWGNGDFVRPHGLSIGLGDTVLVTDEGANRVRCYDRGGHWMLDIDTPDGSPVEGAPFNRCTHAVQISNGDIYVADGYGNARIHAFDSSGTYRFSWGRWGSDPGEFAIPHNICADEDDRLYVADRENHRIQVFESDGTNVAQISGLHRPCALAFDRRTQQLVLGELGPSLPLLAGRSGLGRAIKRIACDGVERATLVCEPAVEFVAPHGIAVDSRGDIYVAEVALAQWSATYPGTTAPVNLPTLRKLVAIKENAA